MADWSNLGFDLYNDSHKLGFTNAAATDSCIAVNYKIGYRFSETQLSAAVTCVKPSLCESSLLKIGDILG